MITPVDRREAGLTGPTDPVTSSQASALAPPDSNSPWPDRDREDRLLIELKQKLALDGQRETLTSNLSAAYHKIGMAVIANLKA